MQFGSALRLLSGPNDPPAAPAAGPEPRDTSPRFHVPAGVRFARETLARARGTREVAFAKLTLAIDDVRKKNNDVSAAVLAAQRAVADAESDIKRARLALDAENVKWTPSVIAALAPARTVAMARLASCCLGVVEVCAELRALDQAMIREGIEPPGSLAAAEIEALRRLAADLVRVNRWSRDAG